MSWPQLRSPSRKFSHSSEKVLWVFSTSTLSSAGKKRGMPPRTGYSAPHAQESPPSITSELGSAQTWGELAANSRSWRPQRGHSTNASSRAFTVSSGRLTGHMWPGPHAAQNGSHGRFLTRLLPNGQLGSPVLEAGLGIDNVAVSYSAGAWRSRVLAARRCARPWPGDEGQVTLTT